MLETELSRPCRVSLSGSWESTSLKGKVLTRLRCSRCCPKKGTKSRGEALATPTERTTTALQSWVILNEEQVMVASHLFILRFWDASVSTGGDSSVNSTKGFFPCYEGYITKLRWHVNPRVMYAIKAHSRVRWRSVPATTLFRSQTTDLEFLVGHCLSHLSTAHLYARHTLQKSGFGDSVCTYFIWTCRKAPTSA